MEKLLLWPATGFGVQRNGGCSACRTCGHPMHLWEVRDGVAYMVATQDTRNPLTHRHIPVRVDEDFARRKGFHTADIPEGLTTRRLGGSEPIRGGFRLWFGLRPWLRQRRHDRQFRAELAEAGTA